MAACAVPPAGNRPAGAVVPAPGLPTAAAAAPGDGGEPAGYRRPRPSPGRRRWSAADLLCLGGLAIGNVWGVVSLGFVPVLIATRPVLLELLTGGTAAMVAAGAEVRVGAAGWATAVVAPLLLWVPLDLLTWWAGRRYGHPLARRLVGHRPGGARALARTEGLLGRLGPAAVPLAPWLPVPNSLVYAAAGWGGTPWWLFLAGDLLGSAGWAGAAVGLGYGLGTGALSVTRAIGHDAALVTAGMLVAGLLWVLWRRRTVAAATGG